MFKIYNFFLQHKAASFIAVLIFAAFTAFLASRIELEEDIRSLIPSGERQDILRKVLDQTEFSDKIIVTISSTSEDPNPEETTRYAQQFIDSVNLQLPEYVEDIQGKVPEEGIREIYNFVYNNLPLFLNKRDYDEIENRLQRDSIQDRLRENFKSLISPTGLVTKEFIFKDPLSLTSLGLRKLQQLQANDDFELYNNFLITRDHRHVLLFISPVYPASETNENEYFIQRLDKIQKNLDRDFPEIKGDFFGGVLYSIANARQIKQDIQLTLGIAATILLFILIFYYRRIYVPLVLFLPVLLGGLSAIAFLFLIKGTVSAISLGIGAILLGISIDYSLHILTHFKKNRNVEQLYRDVTGPVLISSSTTAIAFLCLLFVRSEALNDLGIFAAVSVLVSSLFALILIPVLYKAPVTEAQGSTAIDKIAGFDFHKKRVLVIFFSLLFLTGLFTFTRVNFSFDLAALNYEPEEIKAKEQNIQKIAGRAAKSLYLVSYGNTVDEALGYNNSLYQELRNLEEEDEINSFSSIGGVVLSTSTQLARIEQWKEFWNEGRREEVRNKLLQESSAFGFRPQSFENFYNLLSSNFETLYLDDYRNTTTLYLDDFISEGDNFATVTTSINVEEDKLPQITARFKDAENTVIINRKQLNESFLGNLKNDFNRLIGYSLIAVFLALLLFYRSLELVLLTLFPIGVTWVIALGLMALLNIDFNILNIIISTFIFGLGLDYSIFITNAYLREYETSHKVLATYKTSILLSVFTTLLGIGALFFAEHPALRSISIVSIVGVLSAVSVTFVLQGFLFDRLFIGRKSAGKPAYTFSRIFYSGFPGKVGKLYLTREVLDNYQYKRAFKDAKKEFNEDKERYLKVAEFLEEKDRVLHLFSGYGLLPIYLSYKLEEVKISGYEPDDEKLQVAQNTFRNHSPRLHFMQEFPVASREHNVLILSSPSGNGPDVDFASLITSAVKKIVILDPAYSYRYITDLNFEIIYRQNEVVMLRRMD